MQLRISFLQLADSVAVNSIRTVSLKALYVPSDADTDKDGIDT